MNHSRPHALAVAGAFFVGSLVGCGSSSSPTKPIDAPNNCIAGDLTATPELELYFTDANGSSVEVQSMSEIPLVQPEQGGWVFYVTPRIRNMNVCALQLTTALIDACSNKVITVDSRPAQFQPDGSGFATPINISSEGLVSACPQTTITRNLDGLPYILDEIVMDGSGHQAEAKVTVVPTCSMAFCTCQCGDTYQLGDACGSGTDAGVGDGGLLDGGGGSGCPPPDGGAGSDGGVGPSDAHVSDTGGHDA